MLTGLAPRQVETFVIVPVINGMAGAELRIARGDLEALEHALQNTWLSYRRAGIGPARRTAPAAAGRYPRFDWQLKPYITPSLFDPDDPVRADAGAELSARFEPAPGLEFSGTLRKKVVGNLDQSDRVSTSVLPRVRSDFNIYDREGDPAIIDLVGSYYFQPRSDLYGRISAGYLERMFGGVSGELLWKPVDSRLALGVEVNQVRQRDFDQLWGFQDYDVATGHVSAYWDMRGGYHTRVDAGRYLAGDWGATLTVEREFENGWKIGAFATVTDVSADEFGEGSFDKGLRITIPIGWLSGEPTQEAYTTTIRPVTRDGGRGSRCADGSTRRCARCTRRSCATDGGASGDETGQADTGGRGRAAGAMLLLAGCGGLLPGGGARPTRGSPGPTAPRSTARAVRCSGRGAQARHAGDDAALGAQWRRDHLGGPGRGLDLARRRGAGGHPRARGRPDERRDSKDPPMLAGARMPPRLSAAARLSRRREPAAIRELLCREAGRRPETITLRGMTRQTTRVTERCTSPDVGFVNEYWIGADGLVWKSRQWIGARLGYLETSRLHR